MDDDHVSLSNLQRQILFKTADVGAAKTEAAAKALAALNPGVKRVPHPVRLDPDNAASLIAGYDLVLDGSTISRPASWSMTPVLPWARRWSRRR